MHATAGVLRCACERAVGAVAQAVWAAGIQGHARGRKEGGPFGLWGPVRRVAMVTIWGGRVGALGEWDLLLAKGGLAEEGQSLELGEC